LLETQLSHLNDLHRAVIHGEAGVARTGADTTLDAIKDFVSARHLLDFLNKRRISRTFSD
jgi:protein tyrosine phosphatase